MPTNAGKVGAEIKAYVDKEIPEIHVTAHRKLTLDFLVGAVELAAVDTGRMRYNIRAFVENPVFTDEEPPSASAGGEAERALAALADLQPFGRAGVTCGVEYASYVEDGTPTMAAQPFFGPNVDRIEAQVTA